HLERNLRQHAKTSSAADEKLWHVEAGGVLDDSAPETQQAARTVDETHSENEVTQSAKSKSARTAQPARNGSAECRARIGQQRIERQVLSALGQLGGDLPQRSPRQRSERKFRRLVIDNPAELRGRK